MALSLQDPSDFDSSERETFLLFIVNERKGAVGALSTAVRKLNKPAGHQNPVDAPPFSSAPTKACGSPAEGSPTRARQFRSTTYLAALHPRAWTGRIQAIAQRTPVEF